MMLTTVAVLAILGLTSTRHYHVSAQECKNPNMAKHCSCTETIINCTKTQIVDGNLLAFDTIVDDYPNVEKIIISGNSFHELKANIFGSCAGPHRPKKLQKLKEIDLSYNEISTIDGKAFHCTPSVEKLDLSHNNWYVHPNKGRVFSNMPQLKILLLINATSPYNQDALNDSRVVNLHHVFNESKLAFLEELHLEKNVIVNVPTDIFCDLKSLKKLFLSSNAISHFGFDENCLPALAKLTEIHLDNNQIQVVPPNVFRTLERMANDSLRKVDLTSNPFACDCLNKNTSSFLDWVQSPSSRMLVDKPSMTCGSEIASNKMDGVPLQDVTKADLDAVCSSYRNHSKPAVVVVGIIFALICVGLIVILFLNRASIKKKWGLYFSPASPLRDLSRDRAAYKQGYSSVVT